MPGAHHPHRVALTCRAIGVGEGTWPTVGGPLAALGLTETDLVQQCDAAFKQGLRLRRLDQRQSQADPLLPPFTVPWAMARLTL